MGGTPRVGIHAREARGWPVIGPLLGVVVGVGQYVTVECANAPEHLKTMSLVPWQARSAKVGDRVKLEYRVTPSSGLWVVSHILNEVGGQ